MPVFNKAQISAALEATYGTFPGSWDNHLPFVSENIRTNNFSIQSANMRAGTLRFGRPVDGVGVGQRDAAGSITFEPQTAGFAWWWKLMMGDVQTATDDPESGANTHTVNFAETLPSATIQVNRPMVTDTDSVFTFAGAMVTSWELSQDVDGLLLCTVNIDAQLTDVDNIAKASATYPPDTESWDFLGVELTIMGATAKARSLRIGCNNNLRTDNMKLGQRWKSKPTRAGYPEVTWSVSGMDYDTRAYWDAVMAEAGPNAHGTIVAKWTAGADISGTGTKPQLIVTIPAAFFQSYEGLNVAGPQDIEHGYSGSANDNGEDPVLLVEVISGESTV